MNIQVIHEHSVAVDLLTHNSMVLDCGCRNFGWSKEMLNYVDRVHCWDADKDIVTPDENRLPFFWGAIGSASLLGVQFAKFGNGTGNFILEHESVSDNWVVDTVPMFSLDAVASAFQVSEFDLIKLDIEGMEYGVLSTLKHPIAKQITFELHEHTEKKKGKDYVEKLFEHLGQWYNFSYIDYSKKHGLCENWWDVLIVKK